MINTGGDSKLFQEAAARGMTNGLTDRLTNRESDCLTDWE